MKDRIVELAREHKRPELGGERGETHRPTRAAAP